MDSRTISHYRILSKLGAGGMGEVWLAEDTRLDRKVALKLLPAEFTRDAQRVRRFIQEAKAASALNHPNIITVYDIGESEAGRFIVMELVAGHTLRAIISEDNSLETPLTLGIQIAKALSAAHAAGITHRDIKPDNIMVRDDGYVKVLDFGLARLLPTESSEDAATLAQQTTPGTVMGTIAYMSPEQACGQSASPLSDVFALGIVLYELVTGRHPFRAETLVGYLHAITLQTPAPPSQLKPGVPAALDALILRMLEKDASQRPAASEVARALQEIERRGDPASLQYGEGDTRILPAAHTGAALADEGFWVAVLPFKYRGADTDLEALAEGLSEDIVTGLSRFSYLRVIARSSTLRFTNDSSDARSIGKELGARYVMEGSLRQAGSMLRVAVQLVDAITGAHLWAETYDRQFRAEDIFALQDDLVPRIVSTCADHFGVLARSISDAVRWKDTRQLSPYEALMRGFGYHHRLTPAEHAVARESLERAVEQSPNNADCWAMLSWVYSHEYGHGFNPQPGSLDRALAAAQRAVDLAPSNPLAYQTLAVAYFFRQDKAACLSAAERAMALNPLDASNEAIFLVTFTGDWERGCALIKRAMELNPHHPGWYRWVLAINEYRKLNYRDAVDGAIQANSPGIFWTNMLLAAAYGQLGKLRAAREALQNLLAQKEDFAQSAREVMGKWFDAELTTHLIEGLRKAGLEVIDMEGVAVPSTTTETKARPESSPSIAVLPFGNLSPDPDNEFFADGLTEEVIADLSVIRALRVISRTSAMHFKGTSKDLRVIARELDVRYLLEGSVRRAGKSLRVTAQLIDAENDSHLWAEKYSGSIEDVFAIQEEISRKIVNALQLRLTDAEARGLAERPIDNAAAYDCYMRARHEVYRFTPEGLDRAQKLVDAGLALIGENALLLATRGMVSWYYINFSIRPEEQYLNEAAFYAARALEQDAKSYFGIFLRGLVASKRGDIESAIRDLRIAREQKPGDAMILNELIRHFFSAGQEQGELAQPIYEEALRVDPLHPLNWAQTSWRHFSAGRLAEAVEAARRVLDLTDRGNPARVYAAYYLALAGDREEAIAVFEAEGAALSGNAYGSVSHFLSRALQGDAEGAVRQVTPQLEQAASWTEYLALFLADGYALIGDRDAALRWLRTAVAQGFINYPYLVTRDPFLASLRSDPRLAELMRGVKARWEALSQNRPRPLPVEEVQTQNSLPGTPVQSREVEPSSSPPSATANLNSIAVLPFVNISADEENEYFCDGLAEELLNALSKIEDLRVAARTSAFSFKGKNTNISEIGNALNVGTVLEGSVRRSGNRLRISVQLVNAANGFQLWSERYDREMQDIFDVQDEIALAVVNALKLKLLGEEKAAVLKRFTDNTEAYELYLKGRFFWSKLSPAGLEKAIEYFNQAVSIEPNLALAYAGLADSYEILSQVSAVPVRETMPKAREFAEKALSLDPNLAEAYVSLGLVLADYDYDFVAAETHYKTAIRLNPNNPTAHQLYGQLLAQLGRHEEAEGELRQAIRIDPLSILLNWHYGFGLFESRRYDEAVIQLEKTFEMDSSFPLTQAVLAYIHQAKGNYPEAAESFARFYELVENSEDATRVRKSFADGGWSGFVRMMTGERRPADVTAYLTATLHASLGEKEAAFVELEKAYSNHEALLPLIKIDPRVDSLRDDLRFKGLLKRMNLPE
jgi:non-specific serine/threonine protein kinase